MSWLRWLDGRYMAPAPAERLATARVLTGAFAVIYMIVRGHVLADFRNPPGRFQPVGLAAWLDAPLPPWLVFMLYGATLVSGVAFTFGVKFRWSGPLFALLALWVTSYRNSWGMIFHNENLLVVHLGVLGLSDAAGALTRHAHGDTPGPEPRFGWPLRLMSAATVVAYVLAGIAKLKVTGVSWMDGDVLRNYIAYDAMRKSQIGSIHSPFGGFIVQYAWPFPPLSALTMVLEIGGPLALLHPRLKLAWVLGVWGFHLGVFASMAIAFPYPLSGIAFASFFECERIWRWRWLAPVKRFCVPPASLPA